MIIALLVMWCLSVSTAFAHADTANPSSSPGASASSSSTSSSKSGITVTDSITDTENLLGDHVAAVSDKITGTKHATGVAVRLLYLSSFDSREKPAVWASNVLESTHPARNTVMLAVASNDGNLVVVVSSNSDEWLKSRKTADALSDAALKPIAQDTPNWSGSAIAMMNEIATIKATSTSSGVTRIGVIILIASLSLVALIGVLVFVLRRRGVTWFSRRSGRHSAR